MSQNLRKNENLWNCVVLEGEKSFKKVWPYITAILVACDILATLKFKACFRLKFNAKMRYRKALRDIIENLNVFHRTIAASEGILFDFKTLFTQPLVFLTIVGYGFNGYIVKAN
uniref:Uncharacterized protein n=1 Tax=Glossina austeni TaxID=7395 RepID=A0A1A9UUJ0_GLOAU